MIYTSGTTGKPKGAVRFGGADPAQTQRMIAFYGVHGDDVYLTTGPLYHSGPSGFMATGSFWAKRWCCRRSSMRKIGCACLISTNCSSTFLGPGAHSPRL